MFVLVTMGERLALMPCEDEYAGLAVRLTLPRELLLPDTERMTRRERRTLDRSVQALREELLLHGLRTALPEKRLTGCWQGEHFGLSRPDRTGLLLQLAPRLALLAAEGRSLDLAAVYTDGRMSRTAAAVIAALCGRVRGVAVLPELSGGYLSACYGAADLSSPAGAELHVLLSPPVVRFLPGPNATVLSLCGDLPCLPPGSFAGAAFAPPERLLLRGFDPDGLAAALLQSGALSPEQIVIDRLIRKRGPVCSPSNKKI